MNQNPSGDGMSFDEARNAALASATPLDVVTWTEGPTIEMGALTAAGVVEGGARLFEPMGGEGSAFSVFYKGHDEAMVELLPDLGPMMMWLTDQTVAPTEWESEASRFTITAYSPLFMDSGGGDLELRVFGVDSAGNDALLAVKTIE